MVNFVLLSALRVVHIVDITCGLACDTTSTIVGCGRRQSSEINGRLVDTRALHREETGENKKSLKIVMFDSQEYHQDRPQGLKKKR